MRETNVPNDGAKFLSKLLYIWSGINNLMNIEYKINFEIKDNLFKHLGLTISPFGFNPCNHEINIRVNVISNIDDYNLIKNLLYLVLDGY
mgnify:CR=1 FL=1